MTDYSVLLPQNSTVLEKAVAQLDANFYGSLDTNIIRRVHDPDFAPAEFLPALAWEHSVDEWEPSWPEATKRAVIKASFDVHRHKGTGYAMAEAINATGVGAQLQEWFEYGGLPYRFRLVIDLTPTQEWRAPATASLARVALRTKNVRSLLETIMIRRKTPGATFVGGFIRSRHHVGVSPDLPRFVAIRPYQYTGGYVRSRRKIKLTSEAP